MKKTNRFTPIQLAIYLAFPTLAPAAWAAEPYPALPPTLSTSVTPNVLLHVDNSGSMGNYPPSGGSKKKIEIARNVATALVDNNPNLRWGLFSFDPSANTTGGILQAPIGSSLDLIKTKIAALGPDTYTPLGETLFEITRYFAGGTSYFGKTVNTDSNKKYTSPIQYRCQRNFAIIITDGVSTKDDKLPGLGSNAAVTYTSYDTSNAAVTKTFKVCTSTSTVSSVSCPATLEGATTTTPFQGTSDDSTSYGRSVRDVAAYAYDMDFVTTGNDLDNKSFNDTKFIKQNLQTYTVGFAVDDPVLKATAAVGHGKYYTADNETSLTAALTNAVNDIVASTSNAGGMSTENGSASSSTKVFQPVFNPNGWYGELRCFTLGTGTDFGPACTPNANAVIPSASNRKVYSSVVSNAGLTTSFDFTSTDTTLGKMTASLAGQLGATATTQKNVISFVRGEEGISGFRTRPNGLLGDIVDGQPVVIGKPAGASTDTAYATFQSTNAARNMVAIGANDGMLHLFDVANMTELAAYVPSAVYPHLPALAASDYGVVGGTPHTYHVNGGTRQVDIKVDQAWKTILVGGLGQGGRGYFGLDVTSTNSLASASGLVKWERTSVSNSTLGFTFGTPLIYNVRTSATTVIPAVILPNGYDNSWNGTSSPSNSSSLIIVNAYTGETIKEIAIPNGQGAGLSSPAGADYGDDGILDYVYAGDMNGKLWRFDLTAASPSNFSVAPNPIFDAGVGHPITMRPAIRAVNAATGGATLGNLVIFGTGKLLTNADRSDVTQQALYGVLDDLSDSPQTVTLSQLQQQTITGTATIDSSSGKTAGTYRQVSDNALDLTSATNTKKGWYLPLPVSSERLVTAPLLFDNKVLMGTGIPLTAEKCLPGGQGWIMGLNPMTGSVTKSGTGKKFSFVDLTGDAKSTDADMVNFSTTGDGSPNFISGLQVNAIPTELAFVPKDIQIVSTDSSGSLGDIGSVVARYDANTMAVFSANAKDGTTKGNSQGKIDFPGVGELITGEVGNDNKKKSKIVNPSSGVKAETTIWREIK